MSYFSDVGIREKHLDAFGRVRVSSPEPLFDSMSEYGSNPYLWETSVVGGSVTHVANQNALRLSTGGTTSGNNAIRQTRAYLRYQPGRSLNLEQTFVMGAAQNASRARIGYFDAANGIFLERVTDGAGVSTVNIVRRTFTSGVAVDNAVAQASWNVDPFTGSGPSGKTLDLSKTQILFIQLQFLGVGRVQVGFVIDGQTYVAHQFLNSNILSTVYMTTGCLPVRAEVVNTATAGGTLTLDMICTSVSSGGKGVERIRFARQVAVAGVSTTTTLTPLVSIRAATLLGGTSGGGSLTNRGHIEPVAFALMAASQAHEYQIILNGTLTGPSWQANSANSIADYDLTASAITGGTLLDVGYIPAAASARAAIENSFFGINPLVYSGLGSVQDIITIAARTVTSNGTAWAGIQWDEQY